MKDRLEAFVLTLESYLKTDLHYLFRGGFWLTLGQVTSSLSVFVLGLVFANVLPKDVYGTYKYFLSVAGLISVFSLPGMSTALLRSVSRGYDRTIGLVTATRIRWGFIGTLASLLAALYYWHAGNTLLAEGLGVIALFLPFFDTFNAYGPYLQGKQNFRMYVTIGAIVQITAIACIILAVFLTRDLLAILATYFAAYTLLRFLSWRYVQKRYPPEGAAEPEAIPYGKHLTVISILTQVAGQADTLLTFHFLGAAQVAVYSIAIAAPDQIKNIAGSVSDLLFPRLARRSKDDIRISIVTKGLYFGIVMAFTITLYIALAPWLYHVFFPRYFESIFISQLFALSMLNAFFSPFVTFLQAHGKVREQYVVNVASSLFQIGSMTIGVVWFGLIGLVIARILTRMFGGAINMYFFYVPLRERS